MVREIQGRPPKTGDRYPSGRRKPEQADRRQAVMVRWRELSRVARTYGDASALALDPRMSPDYAPGQLFLLGKVSHSQLNAGGKIATVYGRYERMNGLRRASLSPDYQAGRGRSLRGEPDDAAAREADFRLLSEAVASHGKATLAAVEQFWVEGRHINPGSLSRVLSATTAAVQKFERTKKRRRRRDE